jgi:diacylglycerol kinase
MTIVTREPAMRIMWWIAAASIVASLILDFKSITFMMVGMAFGILDERLRRAKS